jgi:hypothetical protein
MKVGLLRQRQPAVATQFYPPRIKADPNLIIIAIGLRFGKISRQVAVDVNLLGRDNVLTWTVDPATGERLPVGMRPRSPLVIGLDWEF